MRLLKRVEYEAVYGAGQRRSSPLFSIFFRAHSSLPDETMEKEPLHEGSSATGPAADLPTRQAGASR